MTSAKNNPGTVSSGTGGNSGSKKSRPPFLTQPFLFFQTRRWA
jgi:hypothetical protein